ncbi:MAG: hypothetical protein IT369_06755 [Candidatus Latescibacteria bacterium]|nr:hypothetical protein [Candidatus Latescibacterota bacterium]
MPRLLPHLLAAAGLCLALGCGSKLPEPESRPARLYVQYCSGKGCHDAIPPKRGGTQYWEMQNKRMMELMRRQGSPLPSPAEEQEILAYLRRHAQGAP